RASTYLSMDENEKAIADLSEAIRLNPKDPNLFASRAFAFLKQEDFNKVIPDCNEAIRLKNGFRHKKGSVQSGMIMCGKTILQIQVGVSHHTLLSSVYSARSYAYRRKGEFAKALADAMQAITLDPKCTMGYLQRGYAYAGQGQFRQAIVDFSKTIRLGVNGAEPYLCRAGTYYKLNEEDNALRDYNQAIRLDPRESAAYQGRAQVQY